MSLSLSLDPIPSMSWTASLEKARWFAARFPQLADPAVFTASRWPLGTVYAYANETCDSGTGRSEEEFVLRLPEWARPARVTKFGDAIRATTKGAKR